MMRDHTIFVPVDALEFEPAPVETITVTVPMDVRSWDEGTITFRPYWVMSRDDLPC